MHIVLTKINIIRIARYLCGSWASCDGWRWRCSCNTTEERVSGPGTAWGRSGQFRRLPSQRCDGRDRLRGAGVPVATTRTRRPEDPTAPTRLQRYDSRVKDTGWPATEAHLSGRPPWLGQTHLICTVSWAAERKTSRRKLYNQSCECRLKTY